MKWFIAAAIAAGTLLGAAPASASQEGSGEKKPPPPVVELTPEQRAAIVASLRPREIPADQKGEGLEEAARTAALRDIGSGDARSGAYAARDYARASRSLALADAARQVTEDETAAYRARLLGDQQLRHTTTVGFSVRGIRELNDAASKAGRDAAALRAKMTANASQIERLREKSFGLDEKRREAEWKDSFTAAAGVWGPSWVNAAKGSLSENEKRADRYERLAEANELQIQNLIASNAALEKQALALEEMQAQLLASAAGNLAANQAALAATTPGLPAGYRPAPSPTAQATALRNAEVDQVLARLRENRTKKN